MPRSRHCPVDHSSNQHSITLLLIPNMVSILGPHAEIEAVLICPNMYTVPVNHNQWNQTAPMFSYLVLTLKGFRVQVQVLMKETVIALYIRIEATQIEAFKAH